MSYQDLRKGRCSIENQIYFITTVTNNRKPWFQDIYLARILISNMKLYQTSGMVDSYVWVVMPDHLHWLFQLNSGIGLSKLMGEFKGRTAREINKYTGVNGRFWQPSYYDRAIRRNEDIKTISRYIVANPLRANLVECIEDYSHWDAIWL